jgi:2-polyprenyl-3-methyl-5-hydroxy-6-metoxy-1,4-benzoquinol methylase
MPQGPESGLCSSVWFRTFLDTIPAAQTSNEVAFLARQLPLPSHPRILDVCCGAGRHARLLAELGYDVTGVDVDADAIARARATTTRATFVESDVRTVVLPERAWDGVIIMWASFVVEI